MGAYTLGGTSVPPEVLASSSDPVKVVAWRADVKRRGNVAVRWAKPGPLQGELAERTKTVPIRYTLAPVDVRNADRLRRGLDVVTIAAGRVAAAGEGAAKAVLNAPGDLVAGVLGIPSWAGKAVLGAAGAWALYEFTKRGR